MIDLIGLTTDILFPRRCPACHDISLPYGRIICDDCKNAFTKVREPYCLRCGKPVISDSMEFCRECSERSRSFKEGRAVFLYDDIMRRSIYEFKYNGRREYAAYYAGEILKRFSERIEIWKPECFIPVPLHPLRQKKRGYNQAALISRELSAMTGIPTREKLLIREKYTRAQKELNADERQNNLKNAFKLGEDDVKLKSAVLIDDIYTTGSTMNAAAQVLRSSGVGDVYFIALSIGRG